MLCTRRAAIASLLGALAGVSGDASVLARQATGVMPGELAAPPSPPMGATPMDAVSVVERVAPAVVSVINRTIIDSGTPTPLDPSGGVPEEQGAGTGFIISMDGFVITNQHVVDGGASFRVILSNGEERDAELIGGDPVADIAVVRISGEIPGVLAFGDSSGLRVGQPVLAIGSPLGAFTNSVTQGIVIGVNTLGIPEAQGIFFAVPANVVRDVAGELIANGKVSYPFFGVATLPVTRSLAEEEGLSVETGALVIGDVTPESPAGKAGVETGDVILAIDGKQITAEDQFIEVLFAYDPGDTVEVTLQRGDEQLTVTATLVERTEESQ